MKIRIIITATSAALAFSMASPIYAHDNEAQTGTKNFEAAILNIPSKSLKPWRSITRRARPLRPTLTQNRFLSRPIDFRRDRVEGE
jgi:hypothetical protein